MLRLNRINKPFVRYLWGILAQREAKYRPKEVDFWRPHPVFGACASISKGKRGIGQVVSKGDRVRIARESPRLRG